MIMLEIPDVFVVDFAFLNPSATARSSRKDVLSLDNSDSPASPSYQVELPHL